MLLLESAFQIHLPTGPELQRKVNLRCEELMVRSTNNYLRLLGIFYIKVELVRMSVL
jgi:hypothetical protein